MPRTLNRLEQPASLEEIALNAIVGWAVDHCDELSLENFTNRLPGTVETMKNHVRNRLPSSLFLEFCIGFLNKFHTIGGSREKQRPARHYKAALGMILDVEVVGVRCVSPIFGFLEPSDARRLRGVEILDLKHFPNPLSVSVLENFHLNHLTTFIFEENCSDMHLSIIGASCLKLDVLKVPLSSEITDTGLRALSSCSELRRVDLYKCRSVSQNGINDLLSMLHKIEILSYGVTKFGNEAHEAEFDLDSTVQYSSMKRFIGDSLFSRDEHILSLVEKFPNLTCIRFWGEVGGDLLPLRALKITELDFSAGCGWTLNNLKELLTLIGENISLLKLHNCNPNVGLMQNDLDFIFKYCENIVTLRFDHMSQAEEGKLFVPPFKKVKSLTCSTYESDYGIEFGEMLELEILKINGFEVTLEDIKTMILDNVKFPKLAVIEMVFSDISRAYVAPITEIVKNKNLDFVIKDWYDWIDESPIDVTNDDLVMRH